MKIRKNALQTLNKKIKAISYNVLGKGKSLLFCIRGDQGMSGLPANRLCQ